MRLNVTFLQISTTLGCGESPITAPVKSYLDAISHKSEINLKTRRVTPDFSSDLSMGRRPTSKSDEKSGVILLIVKLQRCRKDDFGQHCCSYWRRDPATVADLCCSCVRCVSFQSRARILRCWKNFCRRERDCVRLVELLRVGWSLSPIPQTWSVENDDAPCSRSLPWLPSFNDGRWRLTGVEFITLAILEVGCAPRTRDRGANGSLTHS